MNLLFLNPGFILASSYSQRQLRVRQHILERARENGLARGGATDKIAGYLADGLARGPQPPSIGAKHIPGWTRHLFCNTLQFKFLVACFLF